MRSERHSSLCICASNTSESENLEVQMHDEGRERILTFSIEKELLVKTEWKKVLKSSAFPVSEVALLLSRNTIEGIVLFLLSERM